MRSIIYAGMAALLTIAPARAELFRVHDNPEAVMLPATTQHFSARTLRREELCYVENLGTINLPRESSSAYRTATEQITGDVYVLVIYTALPPAPVRSDNCLRGPVWLKRDWVRNGRLERLP